MTARRWAVVCFVLITALYVVGFIVSRVAGDRITPATVVALSFYAFPLVGVVIAYRRPGNRIAWLCLVVGLAWGLDQTLWGLALSGLANPGTVPAPEILATVADPMWVPGIFTVCTFILLLFPDGTLPSPRWTWLLWLTSLVLPATYVVHIFQPETSSYGRPTIANPMAVFGTETFETAQWVFMVLLLACVVGSVVALTMRFRVSSGVQRQQLKWLASAGLLVGLAWMPAVILEQYVGEALPILIGQFFVLIPLAIGFSVIRYRLYEIDRIISRTVSYGVVVAVLAGVFLGAVTVLSSFLPAESDLAIAGSTLSVAALFNPLRRRVQGWVDRRFNRSRYNAHRVADEFAGSLQHRVDPDEVLEGWVEAVEKTMQPAAVGAWVRVNDSA